MSSESRGSPLKFTKRLSLRGIITLGSVLTAIIIGRSYGVTGLGLYTVILVTVQLAARINSSIGSAARTLIRKKEFKPNQITGATTTFAFLLLFVFTPIIVLIQLTNFSFYISNNQLIGGLIAFVGLGFYHLIKGVYTVKRSDDVPESIRFILIPATTAYIVFNNGGIWKLLLAYGLITFGIGFILIFRCPYPQLPRKETIKGIFNKTPGALFSSLSSNFNHKLDVFVLAIMTGFKGVGYYEASLQLVLFILLFSSSISDYMTLKIQYGGSKYRAAEFVRSSTTYGGFFAFPVLAVTIIFSEELLLYIFGEQFTPAQLVLIALAGTQLIISYVIPFELALKQIGQERKLFIIRFIALLLNIILSVYLLLKIGFLGVIAATAIVEFLTLLSYYIIARLKISHTVKTKEIITQISSAIMIFGIIFASSKIFTIDSFRKVSAVFFLSIIIYSIIFISISNETKERLFDIYKNYSRKQ